MFSTEDLKTAIGATVIARRNAAARLREAGNPRDPFRALPGMEQQFFEAAQSVRSYDLVLNLLEREVKREARKRAGRTAQSAAAFLITAGLILLATLGFAAALLLMKAATARVTNQGINKFGTLYTDTELAYYVNQKVNIKWDIDDVTKLYVYDMDGKKICEAVSAELLAFGPHCSQAALEKHLRDQKRNEREVREYLEERVRPYELRLEDGARPSDAVGMIDLTIKATPSQKLVSLPKDRMFRSEQASKTSRKKATDDTFLNAKGDKALSLLRAMNE